MDLTRQIFENRGRGEGLPLGSELLLLNACHSDKGAYPKLKIHISCWIWDVRGLNLRPRA